MITVFEITGIDFENRGSGLMGQAIVEHFRPWRPGFQLAMRPLGAYQQRAELGLLQKVPFIGNRTWLAMRLLPEPVRSMFGFVTEREIRGVLNASGFAFSDEWGSGPCERFGRLAKRSRAADRKVILLPQAFGPFRNQSVRRAFTRALDFVDLAFARDRQSEHHLRELGIRSEVIRRAPDFTNLVTGVVPEWDKPAGFLACLVPNYRMIDKTDDGCKSQHLRFLINCIILLRKRNIEPVMLLHGDRTDEVLAQEIERQCGAVRRAPRFDGLRLKGIISQSHLVIGSRFHALVSGLSQAVPCIGAGWTHKYAELFAEYGCEDLLLRTDASVQTIERALELALDNRSQLSASLIEKGETQRRLARAMWREVDTLIAGVNGGS